MFGKEASIRAGGLPVLAGFDADAHAFAQVLCDRLRRLAQIGVGLAACAKPEDVERVVPEALALVPARVARLVEITGGGPPVVTAAWPEAARDVRAAVSPACTSLEVGAPQWLESPDAIAARSQELGEAASLLGVHAWGAIPLCGGPISAALELGLSQAPRLDETERAYLAVAARLVGGAILRARTDAAQSDAARLRESEARARRRAHELEGMIDLLPVGVMLISAEGNIERMSPSLRELLGLGGREACPCAPDVLLRTLAVEWPDGHPMALAETPFARARAGEVVRDALLTFQPPGDVRRWIVVNAAPLVRGGKTESVAVAVADVTQTREVELDRKELVRHLFHHLAPPMKAIAERAEQIRDGKAEAARAHAAEIARAVRRVTSNLAELERALLLDARPLTAIHPELVDVRAFVLDLLERLATEVDVARVILSMPAGLPRAHVDPDHLERILTDLIRGALAGGKSDVALICAPAEGRLRMTVASSGQDVDVEDLPRLFERFSRSGGWPAGCLYLVRTLVEANRGRVHAEGRPGRGVVIHVDLPLRPR